ncbi:MAG: carboxypeptidase regulatory-like domain-containing protein [Gemmatimonadota bacterium]
MNDLVRTRLGALVGALLAVASVWMPTSVEAQMGTLQGVVFDSTAMEPLAGARVAVLGTNAVGQTDVDGRFVLGDVPDGSHWVSFFHDRLQQLGVSPQSQQVNFEGGKTVDLALTIPSEETLLLGWCLAEQPAPGFSAIAGIVTDSLTGVPMPRAIVRAEPVGRAIGLQPIEVRTDDSGYFRMCAINAEQDFRLQAHFGQNSGRSVDLYMPPSTAMLQDLVLLMSAEGTLSGYVRDYISGDPVAGATVQVIGTESATLTDLTGRFIMDDLPPGRHLVTTDHLAFEQRTDSVTIFSQETVDIEVRMATEALEVEGLVVTARTRFGRTSLAGDAKRADFITREEIELVLPRVTAAADLLRSMNTPGLRIRDVMQVDELTGVMVPGLCIEISRRSGGEGCAPAAVALNDVVVLYPDQVLRDLDPNIIDRIEILSPIDAQFQFGSVAGNGAIAIYTR